jgi:hypothetical protein
MDQLIYFERKKKYDMEHAEKVRVKHLKNKLNTTEKMELYNSGISGDIVKLQELIEQKKYPLMEECSASGYYWTVLHYAAHYGNVKIIEFILDYYKFDPDKMDILNLQSNLGLSPLLIAINAVSAEKKKQIIDLYIKYDAIDFNICSKDNNEDIFDICKKHNLLEYLLSNLKED